MPAAGGIEICTGLAVAIKPVRQLHRRRLLAGIVIDPVS
jgi:hypothetical protein